MKQHNNLSSHEGTRLYDISLPAIVVRVLGYGTNVRSGPPSMRFSNNSNRLYVEDGCATMADLMAFRTTALGIVEGPIYYFDPVNCFPVDAIQYPDAKALNK